MLKREEVHSWKEIVDTVSPFPDCWKTFVFVSMGNSGKSTSVRNLVIELLSKVKHNHITLFSNTAYKELNKDYAFLKGCPFADVFPGNKETIDKQTDAVLDYCQKMKANKEDYGELVIFDDVDVTKKNDKVSELFTQGRHYNMNVIVSCQNAAYFVNPTVRDNIDYLMFRKTENTYKRALWEACNTRMTFPEFKQFIDDNTEDYKFILYDNVSQKGSDKERLKIVKAELFDEMKATEKKKATQRNQEEKSKATELEPRRIRTVQRVRK